MKVFLLVNMPFENKIGNEQIHLFWKFAIAKMSILAHTRLLQQNAGKLLPKAVFLTHTGYREV